MLHGDPQASTSLASHILNFVPHRTLCLSPHPPINPKDPFSLRVLEVTIAFLVHQANIDFMLLRDGRLVAWWPSVGWGQLWVIAE